MNLYRTGQLGCISDLRNAVTVSSQYWCLAIVGGDIGPNFASVIGESYATVQYNDRPDPFSHPGCWACEYQPVAAHYASDSNRD